jgi:hypothetical protein
VKFHKKRYFKFHNRSRLRVHYKVKFVNSFYVNDLSLFWKQSETCKRILSYSEISRLAFGRNFKIFTKDDMAVITSKISIWLHRVILQKRHFHTRIHCVSVIQGYINAEAGDTHNNYCALNDWPQILYRSLSILTTG